MSQLALSFLGSFSISLTGQPLKNLRTDKTRALLAYLAMEPQQAHSRRQLAGLLWPEVSDKLARQSLRAALYQLRQRLDQGGADIALDMPLSQHVLTITHQTIQLNTAGTPLTVDSDVMQFRTLIAAAEAHPHDNLAQCDQCLAQLEQATALYRGEFLAGFGFGDAPDFEEWVLLHREMLHQQALLAFDRLAGAYENRGDYEQAYSYAARLLHLDPYRETSQRIVIRLLALRGLPDQALAQYASCRQLLLDQLGAEPETETVTLVEAIKRGELSKGLETQNTEEPEKQTHTNTHSPAPYTPTSPRPNAPTPPRPQHIRHDWHEMPTAGAFYGRETEAIQLENWLVNDRCQLVSILGIGGIGKTSLAAHVVAMLADQFDLIIWRSLPNAPPLAELLSTILPILSNQQVSRLPESLDQQLQLLFGYLQDQRVLLILDNVESLLQATNSDDQARAAGSYQPDYEPYGQLLHGLTTQQHQGQLLLTSRERPTGIKRLERDNPLVRSLSLGGLDDMAGQQLLISRGLSGTETDEANLIQRYSGNPLALKLVADTVQDLFLGDMQEFLAEDTFIFDDVRRVLDQQFARLSALEQALLFWLAIEREPVDAPTLRNNLLQPPSGRYLLEALNGLHRRSLIERHAGGFALQNVIIEYLTDRLVETAIQELTHSKLNLLHGYSFMKAQAKEFVREGQIRLLLTPVTTHLLGSMGQTHFVDQLQNILTSLRETEPRLPSYAGGNILNLLLQAQINVTGFNFSQLAIWQGYLQGFALRRTNFTGTDFSHTVFTGKFGTIRSVAIGLVSEAQLHPKGEAKSEFLAASTDNSDILLWQLETCQPMGVLQGHTHHVLSIAISSDGQYLASGSGDCKVGIWDVAHKTLITMLDAHEGPVRTVAFSPDGKLLASGSEDYKVRLWDVQTGKLLSTIAQHTDWVNALNFHPNGHLLASGGNDGTVYLWDVPELIGHTQKQPVHSADKFGKLMTLKEEHKAVIFSLAFSPDGSKLACCGGENSIEIRETATGRLLHMLEGHSALVYTGAFSPDGATLATGSMDQTVRLWDVDNGRALDTLHGHKHTVRSVAFNSAGNILISGALDDTIRLWSANATQRWRSHSVLQGYTEAIMAIDFSPDSTQLVVGTQRGQVLLWDGSLHATAPKSPRNLGSHQAEVRSVCFNPDGTRIATGSFDKRVCIWPIKEGHAPNGEINQSQSIWDVAYSHSGTILASAGEDCTISIWDVYSSSQPQLLQALQENDHTIQALAFSPDDQVLASGTDGAGVQLWDVDSGNLIQTLPTDSLDCLTVAFHPGGELLIGGDRSGLLYMWSMREQEQGLLCKKISGHSAGIHQVAFSPTGDLFASASSDQTVRLWHAHTGQLLNILDGHEQSVWSLAFRLDGKVLATGSFDGTVKLWDVERGQCLQTLQAPGPYEGMTITDVTGISEAQKATLKMLGAVEEN